MKIAQNLELDGNLYISAKDITKIKDSIITENIIKSEDNLVVVDFSDYLLERVGGVLYKSGYTVKVLDLREWKENTYNPLRYMKAKNIPEYALRLSNIISEKTGGKNNEKIFSLLIATMSHIYYDYGSDGCIGDIYHLLSIIKDTTVADFIKEDFPPSVISKYEIFIECSEGFENDIVNEVYDALEELSNDDIMYCTSSSSIELDKMKKEKYALFVITPDSSSESIIAQIEYIFLLSQLNAFQSRGKVKHLSAFLNGFGYCPPTNDNITCIYYEVGDKFEDDSVYVTDLFEKSDKAYQIPPADLSDMTEDVNSAYKYSEYKEDEKTLRGVLARELLMQYTFRMDMDPERIKKIVKYKKFKDKDVRDILVKDAYETAKYLFTNKDFMTIVSYIVRTCDCLDEFKFSTNIIQLDEDGYIPETESHKWYNYILQALDRKIHIIDPTDNLYPEILHFIIYYLTVDKNLTFSILYNYFYEGNTIGSAFIQSEDEEPEESYGDIDYASAKEDKEADSLPPKEISTDDSKCDATGFNEEKVNECLAELDSLIGLEYEKAVIHEIVNIIFGNRLREESGNKPFPISSYHIAFTGNPGTGKTTVARIYAKILHYCGILSKGSLLEVGRVDLVGGYLGQTAIKTQKTIDKAEGGVLFIDEAYSLLTKDDDAYGHECVSTLVQNMENKKESVAFVFAGYTKEMNDFLKTNPGLKSRIYNIVEFKDYTIDELMLIFDKMCHERGFVISDDIRDKIKEKVILDSKNKEFGNARGIRNYVDTMTKALLTRTVEQKLTGAEQNIITENEVEKITVKKSDVKQIGFK